LLHYYYIILYYLLTINITYYLSQNKNSVEYSVIFYYFVTKKFVKLYHMQILSNIWVFLA